MNELPETIWVTFDNDGDVDDVTRDQQTAYDYARRADYSSPVPYVPKEQTDALARDLSEASVELGAVIEAFQQAGYAEIKLPPSAAVRDVLKQLQDLAEAHQDAGKMWVLRMRERDEALARVRELEACQTANVTELHRADALIGELRAKVTELETSLKGKRA